LSTTWENASKDLELANEILEIIYKISHLNGTCENEHLDWHELGHEIGQELIEKEIIDYRI